MIEFLERLPLWLLAKPGMRSPVAAVALERSLSVASFSVGEAERERKPGEARQMLRVASTRI